MRHQTKFERAPLPKSNWSVVGITAAYLLAAPLRPRQRAAQDPGQEEGSLEPSE